MNRKIVFTTLISVIGISSYAQMTIDQVLGQVEKNNKSLLAEKQHWQAQKLSYKTGLTPDNPKAEIDYMIGRPAGAGNQQDIAVTQGFDFPTSYGKRKNVSNEQTINADHRLNIARQEILLETKHLCIEFIFRSKLQQELLKRLLGADLLLKATNEKTNRGESNILDLNKVKLLQLDIKNQVDINATAIKTTQHKVDEMNGGVSLNISKLGYTPETTIPAFEALDSLIEVNDPVVKAIKQEREVSQQQLELARSLALPKVEGGYHRQSILGQTYEGFHFGMTIPLWENKNKIKTQQARLTFSEFQIQDHRTQHYFENKQLYEQYLQWKNTFNQYQTILSSANNEHLLNKALHAGQINVIEYLMETRYFYEAITRSLEAEKELYDTVATLYKFSL